MLVYLLSIIKMKLTLSIYSMKVVKWWEDVLFATH